MRFRFVDSITKIKKGEFICGKKVVSFEEGYLKKPYAKPGFIPRTLLMESLAQLASWLVIYSFDFLVQPLIASVQEIHIHDDVRVGSALEMECQITNLSEQGAVLQCWGSVNQREIIRANDCTVFFLPLDTLQDPNEAKADFGQLTRKAEIQ